MLDDAERQSIREWFRGLVRSRSAASESPAEDEETRLTRDLRVPRDLASDVKGGTDGGPPAPPTEPDE
jgi:hypothetical protein